MLSDTAQRVEQNRDEPAKAAAETKAGMSELLQQARASSALEQKVEEVQPQASRAAWITFGALVLSLRGRDRRNERKAQAEAAPGLITASEARAAPPKSP